MWVGDMAFFRNGWIVTKEEGLGLEMGGDIIPFTNYDGFRKTKS